MKTMLVPTDFSAPARQALAYALTLASLTKSRVVVFHAFHRPINLWEAAEVTEKIASMEAKEKARLQKLVEEVRYAAVWKPRQEMLEEVVSTPIRNRESLLPHPGADPKERVAVACVAKFGLVEDAILEAVIANQVDLIVMGMRGDNPMGDIFLGNTTTGILRRGKVPFLIIPEKTVFEPIREILFATDFKGLPADAILQPLFEIKQLFGAKLTMLHLYTKDEEADLGRNAAADDLEYRLRSQGYTLYFVEREKVLEGIREQLEALEPQVLAVVPRRHGFLTHLLGLSTTQQLASKAGLPLLVFPDIH